MREWVLNEMWIEMKENDTELIELQNMQIPRDRKWFCKIYNSRKFSIQTYDFLYVTKKFMIQKQ